LLLFLAREATKEMAPPRPSYAIDDGELSISLSSSQIRRGSRINANSPLKTPDNPTPSHAHQHHHHHIDHAHAHALDTSDPSSNMASASAPTSSAIAGPIPDKVRTDQRIGQYNIVKTLGEGSFGKVKLAVHRSTGQQVALKIISRKKLISRDMAGRVEREIEYLQLLRHPHIIKL
jgi:carbon catabolite-derepressing protein kinase